MYLKDIRSDLSRKEEKELVHRMRKGDQAAKKKLILSVTPWVMRLVSKWCYSTGNDYEDVFSEMMVHLIRSSLPGFAPARGRLCKDTPPQDQQ